jgi:predicted RNA-binding Zn-ribbon protein involved in translation (DUF1610 family)
MKNQAITCQNCGRQLARWTEDGAVAYWPCEVTSDIREIDADHTKITFICPDCGCKVAVRT